MPSNREQLRAHAAQAYARAEKSHAQAIASVHKQNAALVHSNAVGTIELKNRKNKLIVGRNGGDDTVVFTKKRKIPSKPQPYLNALKAHAANKEADTPTSSVLPSTEQSTMSTHQHAHVHSSALSRSPVSSPPAAQPMYAPPQPSYAPPQPTYARALAQSHNTFVPHQPSAVVVHPGVPQPVAPVVFPNVPAVARSHAYAHPNPSPQHADPAVGDFPPLQHTHLPTGENRDNIISHIVDSRFDGQVLEYRVRWLNTTSDADRWYPAESIRHMHGALIERFHRENPTKAVSMITNCIT